MSQTLDLENGSLLAGNVLPPSCSGYSGVAVAAPFQKLFATCTQPGMMITFNTSTDSLQNFSPTTQDPVAIAFDPANNEVYVANNGSSNVTVLSAGSGSIIASIPVGGGMDSIAYDDSSENLFATSYNSGNVTEIASSNDTVLRVIPLGASTGLEGIAYDSYNHDLYTAEAKAGAVGVISGANLTVIATVAVAGQPLAVCADPGTGAVYVGVYIATMNSNPLRVISGVTQRVVANVSVGFGPDAISFDWRDNRMYVANGGSDNVSVVDARMNVPLASIAVSYDPVALSQNNDTGIVYAADWTAGNVAVINESVSKTVRFLALNPGPDQVTWNGLTGEVDATTFYSGQLVQVDGFSDQLVSASPVWYALTGIAVDSSNGHAYVASGARSEVYDVDGSGSILGLAPVGDFPIALAYDGTNGMVYSTSLYNDSVSVINSTTDHLASTISLGGVLGANPADIVFDSSSGYLFIAMHGCLCFGPANITILNTRTNRIVGSIQDWVNPGPSSIVIDKQNRELYVTDDYSNLLWAFNLSTDNLTSLTPVGLAPEGAALDPLNGYLYVTNSGSNNVSVVNTSTNSVLGSINVGSDPFGVTFDPLSRDILVANEGSGTLSIISGAYAPVATFTESGLPTGTEWWVNATDESSANSTGTTISLTLADGSYPYTVASANKQFQATGGTLILSGAIASVSVVFTELAHEVTFTETGLPAGTPWEVSLNGTPLTSTSPWINFTEVAGSYPFIVGGLFWYDSTPTTGEVSVVASNQSIQIAFSLVLDQFLIGESNLPSDTNWSMTLGQTTEWSTQPWLEFNVTNGTYNYSIRSVDGYAVTFLTHSDSDAVEFRLATTDTYSGQLQIYTRWVNATLEFMKEPSTSGTGGLLGLSEVDWAGIIVLVTVVAIVGVIAYRRSRHPVHAPVSPPPPARRQVAAHTFGAGTPPSLLSGVPPPMTGARRRGSTRGSGSRLDSYDSLHHWRSIG